MAEPTPGIVPVVLQTGDPTNSIVVIRAALAGGQDIIFRTGAEPADVNLQALVTEGDPLETLTVSQLYIGARARFVALSNGLKLEVQDDLGTWHTQISWTEGSPA